MGYRTDYRKHVRYYYNKYAFIYDFMEFVRQGTRRKAIHMSGCRSGERVLDLCTGTGEMALAFARKGADVIGVDIARGMLRRAQTKNSIPNLTWVEMDASELPFGAKSFDISSISLALHHMPKEVQIDVLCELRRVTRKRVVIIEPHTPTDPRWFSIWAHVQSLIDESEYMHEWVRQDFIHICHTAGLFVDTVQVTAAGLHRITLCNPTQL